MVSGELITRRTTSSYIHPTRSETNFVQGSEGAPLIRLVMDVELDSPASVTPTATTPGLERTLPSTGGPGKG